MNPDDRITELETRLAWQERLIGELNDALAAQQRQIDALEKTVGRMRERLLAALDSGLARPDEEAPPPHY